MSDSAELDRLREAIDQVDERILRELNERARLARAIGTLKVGQAYRPEREAQVLRRIKERNPGPLSGETVALIFREIMSACLALERPLTVAYLGPKGTFSERAALKQFPPPRSTRCSARSSRAARTSASCRWRTPPKARSAVRSTSCRRRR
jgi:chorismate mutase/prephenate dehydratase